MKFSLINHGYFRPKKETEMRRIGSIIVWNLEKKDTAKAGQCLATSDDTASKLYQIQISKSIYNCTRISFRHRYKLKKLTNSFSQTSISKLCRWIFHCWNTLFCIYRQQSRTISPFALSLPFRM